MLGAHRYFQHTVFKFRALQRATGNGKPRSLETRIRV